MDHDVVNKFHQPTREYALRLIEYRKIKNKLQKKKRQHGGKTQIKSDIRWLNKNFKTEYNNTEEEFRDRPHIYEYFEFDHY